MIEDKSNIQVTLYVSKMSRPVVIEKGCKKGHCHSLIVDERLLVATTNLEKSFYSTETQKVIFEVSNLCEKHDLPLEIKDITGIVKGIRYLLIKRILRTPALEITLTKEKFKLNPAYPFDSSKVVALYSVGEYGTVTYGGQSNPLIRQPIEGSGFAIALRVVDNGVSVPYSLKGFQLEFKAAARR